MKNITYLFKLLFILFISLVISSCENPDDLEELGSIHGRVVQDSENNAPIKGVSLTTNPATTALLSDANGQFSFSNIAVNSYNITAKKSGYSTNTVSVVVKKDETTMVTLVLLKDASGGSSELTQPTPIQGASNIPVNVLFKWQASNPDHLDSLRFDVILYKSNSSTPQTIASNLSDSTYQMNGLEYNTTYFWQVVANNEGEEIARSETWSFTTVPLPSNPFLFTRRTEGNTDIYTADTSATKLIQLTSNIAQDHYPMASPTNELIAFSSDRSIEPQLFTMNMAGKNIQQISQLPIAGYHNPGEGFCWSPDGSELLYPHYDKLYKIRRDGSGLELVATAPQGRHFRSCDWSGPANKIVVQTMGTQIFDSEFYLMNPDGSEKELWLENLPGRMDRPSFSVDGKHILYTRDVDGFEDINGRQLNAHIFLQHLDSVYTSALDLSYRKEPGTNDLSPRFSPNGANILFVHTSNTGQEPQNVWSMNIQGNQRKEQIENAQSPYWK